MDEINEDINRLVDKFSDDLRKKLLAYVQKRVIQAHKDGLKNGGKAAAASTAVRKSSKGDEGAFVSTSASATSPPPPRPRGRPPRAKDEEADDVRSKPSVRKPPVKTTTRQTTLHRGRDDTSDSDSE